MHWRGKYTLGIICVIAIIVIILFILLFTLPSNTTTEQVQTQKPSFFSSLFKTSSNLVTPDFLGTPQILEGDTNFGEFVFVHDKGFVAISTPTNHLVMYQILDSIVKIPDIQLPLTLPNNLGTGNAIICNGCFMPSLNTINENYYLVVSLGVQDSLYPNYRFARRIYIYYCASGTTQFKFSRTLDHPYFTRSISTLPYVGCFGNRLQGVLDDNNIQNVRQSLYVHSTEWEALNIDRPQPSKGGSVLWFIFFTNDTVPEIVPQLIIQDAKLTTISKNPDTPVPFPLLNEIDYYMRGFGSVFYVQSGQRTLNLLAISNLTNQDTVSWECDATATPNAPHGYVQVFSVGQDPQSPGWVQNFVVCPVSTATGFNQQIYVNRIILNPSESTVNGFGGGVLLSNNFLLSSFESAMFSFNLASANTPPALNAPSWGHVNLDTVIPALVSSSSFPGPMFNLNLFFLKGFIGIATYAVDMDVNTIGFFNTRSAPVVSPSPPSAKSDIFVNFGQPVSVIGANGENSGGSATSLTGFGQFIGVWFNTNRTLVHLIVNDPLGNRVLLYTMSAN